MPRQRLISWFFYLNLALIAALLGYKAYLNFFEQDFASAHADQVNAIESMLTERETYRFAVLGNINNSVGIFERKIIPRLNREGYDFIISAGNAVASGGEDKYRALFGTLSYLDMPYLLTFGPHEESRLGGFRFYDHFGPYHFSFAAGKSRFTFLDSTGTTDFGWQMRWLDEVLAARREPNQFLFSAHPLYPVDHPGLFGLDDDDDYHLENPARQGLTRQIEQAGVDAVFSSQAPLFDRQQHGGTTYITTGGAGGLVLNDDESYHHFVSVSVDGDEFQISERRLDIGQHPIWRTLESLWFFIYSLFYVGYLNFILIVSTFIAIALWLYKRIFTEQDYYPDFDIDPDAGGNTPLHVAMFTNNYLPFIGGVPISVERLKRGLKGLHNSVLVVAPGYPHQPPDEEADILRLASLLPMGRHKEFRLANIFSWRLVKRVRAFAPQVIHVHHPFWIGRAGQLLGRLLRVPVVYTYHTRLEHYAHYVPLPGPLFRNLISHALVKRFANGCDAVIVPTSSAEEYMRIIGVKQPIFVQPTGIEYARFATADSATLDTLRQRYRLEGKRVLVSISRLSKEKNIDFMLDGLALLRDSSEHDFHLLLLGEGHDHERLQARIEVLGLSKHVTLVGAVPPDEVACYCHLAELFVFASRSETQGMVVLEAMAAGLPVVVIRSSGIEDIVQHGVNGYKTAPDPQAWCGRIDTLLSDDTLKARMSEQASHCAAEHRIEQFATAVLRVYRYVIEARRKSHAD
ncbi:Glycosyltransferase involved in cell wall bisynthesis [Vreelandella subterranea]|uniref:Glycosyltransferase involved in cell wall bisynthesis n=1 Tax=Vreelandella subterranea TaxID=416874 RepID=A0A1H9WHJ9_9GAMM|nr:glycosyltransferase [Halomonas subterranea]SES33325.1 Glycosyltransferase involved in cell wall bisynthesis [Halomonas subterranea]